MQDSHFPILSAHLLLPVSVTLLAMSESQSRRYDGLSETVHSIREQVRLPAASTQEASRDPTKQAGWDKRLNPTSLTHVHVHQPVIMSQRWCRQEEGLDLELHLSSLVQEGIPHSQEDVADQAVHKGHQKPVEGDE